MKMWINKMELRRLRDLYDSDGSSFTSRELEEYYDHRLKSAGPREVATGGAKSISYDELNRQWRSFIASIPDRLRDQVRGVAPATGKTVGVYSDVARKLMSAMGWYGGGIGKNEEGPTEPIEAVGSAGSDRKGLGYSRSRKGPSSKVRPSSLRAITYTDEEGDEVLQYGYVTKGNLEVVELSPRGRPVRTGARRGLDSSDLVREVVWWGDGVLGVAEATYPHPQGWTVEGASGSPTLDQLTVRTLTKVFRRQREKPPTCMAAWTSRLGGRIPWQDLGTSFQNGLLTPKDYCSYFKNVLHRALLTRNRKPSEDGDTKCRCCHAVDESLSHLPDCPSLLPLWNKLLSLIDEPHSSIAILLGVGRNGHALPLGWRALWLIVWKFVIINFTQIGVGETATVNVESTWELALRRLAVRVHAVVHNYRSRLSAAEARGHKPPAPASTNKLLEPLASLNEQGALTWHPTIADTLKSMGIEGLNQRPNNAKQTTLPPIKFVKQTSKEECSEALPIPPLTSEVDRYAWHVTRHITAQRSNNRVTLYSVISIISGIELQLVPAGHSLPTDTFTCYTNPSKDETHKQLCSAMRKSGPTNLVYQSRPQILVFNAEHGREAAEAYVNRLWQSGLGDKSAITAASLPCSNAHLTRLVSRALRRYNAIHLDIYPLTGPKAAP